MSWNDERVETLKKLWAEGHSASQIAAELGGVTRNAVIGKVHRMGLAGRAKSPAAAATARPRKPRSAANMMRITRAPVRGNTALALAYELEAEAEPELADNVIPIGQRRSLLELHRKRLVAGRSAIPAPRISSSAAERRSPASRTALIIRAWRISPPMYGATAACFAGRGGFQPALCIPFATSDWPGRVSSPPLQPIRRRAFIQSSRCAPFTVPRGACAREDKRTACARRGLEGEMEKVKKSGPQAKARDDARRELSPVARPTRAEAEAAVRTLIRWAGDEPDREGLIGTPARVVRAYEEWFAGNFENPTEYLQRTFEEVAGYDEIVVLRDIRFESHCEHHIAPIIGRVHIGYLPRDRVIGISKLARLVNVYAKRLQVQEKMTAEIAKCLNMVLKPHGVGVVVEATHECMTTRGVHNPEVSMVTSCMLGSFRTRAETRNEFLAAINLKGAARRGNALE